MDERQIARNLEVLAAKLSEEAPPSATSVWWRIQRQMQRERARRIQLPLIWMTRAFYSAIGIVALLIVSSFSVWSEAIVVGQILTLAALAVPVSFTLWHWYRSGR